MTKRDDLQGIRGLSIILVLLFHLFPAVFPNGFVGVDIFFVLSGYLMTMIYSQKIHDFSAFGKFYTKRLTRLMPMFSALICATVIYGKFALILGDDERLLNHETKWSLLALTNVRLLYESDGYWTTLTDFSFLLHVWSLSVELQYYLMAPFLFWLQNNSFLGALAVITVSLGSLAYTIVGNSKISFYLVFSRLWQFQVGAVSCQMTLRGYGSLWLSLVLFSFLIPYFPVSTVITRLIGTFASGLLFSSAQNSNFLITNRFLTYFGDISYVLYLIHWPVIVFIRYNRYYEAMQPVDYVLAAILSISLSVLVHHYIEKPLLQRVWSSLMVSALCYVITGWTALQPKDDMFAMKPTNVTGPYYWSHETFFDEKWTEEEIVENAIAANMRWKVQDYGIPVVPGCEQQDYPYRCDLRNSNGTLKLTVIGNSFAIRFHSMVYEIFKNRFAQLTLIVKYGHEILDFLSYGSDDLFKTARPQLLTSWNDVVFIVQQFARGFRAPINGELSDDPVTVAALQFLNDLSQSTGHIVISGVLAAAKAEFTSERMAHTLYRNVSQLKSGEYLYQDFLDMHASTLKRIDHILAKCPKCSYFDLQQPFCDDSKTICRGYDNRTLLAYYRDASHHTLAANDVVMPHFSDFVDKMDLVWRTDSRQTGISTIK